jgi:hypothetical protein
VPKRKILTGKDKLKRTGGLEKIMLMHNEELHDP